MIQLTIMKITGYGPWTLTLGSDREHELQMLQSQLYNKLQELFSKKTVLFFLIALMNIFQSQMGFHLMTMLQYKRN